MPKLLFLEKKQSYLALISSYNYRTRNLLLKERKKKHSAKSEMNFYHLILLFHELVVKK